MTIDWICDKRKSAKKYVKQKNVKIELSNIRKINDRNPSNHKRKITTFRNKRRKRNSKNKSMYHDGEWFDLPTFYQRICDLPRLEPPVPNDVNENHNECSPNQASGDSSTNPDDLSGLEVSLENKNNNENYNECSTTQSSEDSSTKPDDNLSGLVVSVEIKNINENYNECSPKQASEDSSTNPDEDLSGLEVSVENKNNNENYNECSTTQSRNDSSTNPDDCLSGFDVSVENTNINKNYTECSSKQASEDSSKNPDDDISGLDVSVENNNINENYNECSTKQSSEDSSTKPDDDGDCGEEDDYEYYYEDEDYDEDKYYDDGEDDYEDSKGGNNQNQHHTTCDNFVKDSSMETLTSRDPQKTESGDTDENTFSILEDAFFGINLTTETIGCYSESIDSSLQSSFPEAIKEGISRIADDSSLMKKTEAPVGKTLFGNDRFTENSEEVREAITDDKSRIDNDPSLESKTDVPVEEKLLDCDENTENLEKVQKSIPEGSSLNEDNSMNPPLAETDEYTYYYPTRSTTRMKVIQVCRSLDDVEDDPILRCRIGISLKCNFCDDHFSSREKRREHVKTRIYGKFVPSGAYICSRYSRRYCIVLGYNSSGRVQYKCSHCLKRFKRFGDYARHCNNEKICKRYQSYLVSPLVKPCWLGDEEGFECLFCHESSKDYADLKFHECIMRRNPPEKCYEDLPADEDADDDGVDDYVDDNDGVDSDGGVDDGGIDGGIDDGINDDSTDESIKCDLCGVEFHGSQIYAEHRREHDSGEKYGCKVCYQSFKRLCSFKTHMAVNHKVKTRAKKERSANRKP